MCICFINHNNIPIYIKTKKRQQPDMQAMTNTSVVQLRSHLFLLEQKANKLPQWTVFAIAKSEKRIQRRMTFLQVKKESQIGLSGTTSRVAVFYSCYHSSFSRLKLTKAQIRKKRMEIEEKIENMIILKEILRMIFVLEKKAFKQADVQEVTCQLVHEYPKQGVIAWQAVQNKIRIEMRMSKPRRIFRGLLSISLLIINGYKVKTVIVLFINKRQKYKNLKMFYINIKEAEGEAHKLAKEDIISVLIVPKSERSVEDHQMVYAFFHNHPFFIELERTKSLNGRISCIGELEIKSKKPDQQQYEIVATFKLQRKEDKKTIYDNYYAVIPTTTLCEIKNRNEGHLRKGMETLATFSICQQMKYQQLLHLAFYMERTTYKYKQYVFKEGSQSNYLYLVLQGQFQYIKQLHQNCEQKKPSKPKRYKREDEVSPNKLKKSKSRELKVGIIEGGFGQVMGEEELISKEKRKYSVQCMSTENEVIKIEREYYMNVIKEERTKRAEETRKKTQLKKETLEKILETKRNYQKYINAMEEEKLNKSNSSIQADKSDPETDKKTLQVSQKTLKQNKKLIKNLSKSKIKQNKKITHPQTYENQPQKQQEEPQQQNGDTFSLTHPVTEPLQELPEEGKRKKQPTQSLHITESSKSGSFLPEIATPKNDSLDLKVAKSWSVSRPTIDLKKMKSKYSGMIDSSTLIKEKEIILAKKMPQNIRQEIFPKEQPKRKHYLFFKYETVRQNKEALRQMRSAVHSKDFMQKMLVNALKKAGYEKKKEEEESELQFHQQTKKKLKILKEKRKNFHRHQGSGSLLEDNPFDQFYFKKFE